jgi:hypothetical protein
LHGVHETMNYNMCFEINNLHEKMICKTWVFSMVLFWCSLRDIQLSCWHMIATNLLVLLLVARLWFWYHSTIIHVWCLGVINGKFPQEYVQQQNINKKIHHENGRPKLEVKNWQALYYPNHGFFPLFFVLLIFWHKKLEVFFFSLGKSSKITWNYTRKCIIFPKFSQFFGSKNHKICPKIITASNLHMFSILIFLHRGK